MIGLILDGLISIGTFDDSDIEDNEIVLSNVSIDMKYVDIVKYKTKKLHFIETLEDSDKYIVSKDHGYCIMSGIGMWIEANSVYFVSGTLKVVNDNAN